MCCEFSKELLTEIKNPNCRFYKVYKNGKCYYDEFLKSLTQPSDINAFKALMAIMDRFDTDVLESKGIVNSVHGGKKDRKDILEFKRHDIRIYFTIQAPGVFVLMGGYKKDQKKMDIPNVFRRFNHMPSDIPDKD